jgi:hypothetical protein
MLKLCMPAIGSTDEDVAPAIIIEFDIILASIVALAWMIVDPRFLALIDCIPMAEH